MAPERPAANVQRIGGEPVMWCACACGKRVWNTQFSVPDEITGTNLYFVDEQHYELWRLRRERVKRNTREAAKRGLL